MIHYEGPLIAMGIESQLYLSNYWWCFFNNFFIWRKKLLYCSLCARKDMQIYMQNLWLCNDDLWPINQPILESSEPINVWVDFYRGYYSSVILLGSREAIPLENPVWEVFEIRSGPHCFKVLAKWQFWALQDGHL